MDPTFALLMAAAFVVCAALLWLAAELAVAATLRPLPIRRAVLGVAAVLGACGLGWPANVIRAADPVSAAPWLLSWLPALALAALAGAVGLLWDRERRGWALLAAAAIPIAAYQQTVINAPDVLRLAPESVGLGIVTLTLTLSAALIAMQIRWRDARIAAAMRAGGGLFVALLVCVGAAGSTAAGEPVAAAFGPAWGVVAGLVAISTVLRGLLRQPAVADHPARHAGSATVDNLTGLPTRLSFESQLQDAAKQFEARRADAKKADAQRVDPAPRDPKAIGLAVLFIDLDGFKPVNDSFGHSSGDRVLEQVGQRLKAIARGTGVAARVGGDEFLLLALGERAPQAVARLAKRLIDALSEPYRIDDREVAISCSVGIALYPDGCHPNKLIARADAAMYAAKRAGGARHCFYAPEMDADVQQNFDMLRDLRQALVKDQLELFFQPKVDARSGKVTAAEALLRWNHPRRGFVMPAQFIPLAERSGLIGPLGNWVIEAACKQARAWRDKGLRMRVAINLSAYQMRQDDIADRIAEALARHRIHPSLLTCEITESAAMEDTGATQQTFRRLGEMGAHLSIDDFGTGYSSLSYLRQLPAEELKIDASFVKDVDHSADARAVVDAVVKLAHALGLKVVAEGVENLRQHKVLVELGCDELQGYLFAKPMTARALLLWAMDDRSTAAVFRDSLFSETRQALQHASHPSDLESVPQA